MEDLKKKLLISVVGQALTSMVDDSSEELLLFLVQEESRSGQFNEHHQEQVVRKVTASTRIPEFVEHIVPKYSEMDFRSHFRMSRHSFQVWATSYSRI
jgi:hypothetical protein